MVARNGGGRWVSRFASRTTAKTRIGHPQRPVDGQEQRVIAQRGDHGDADEQLRDHHRRHRPVQNPGREGETSCSAGAFACLACHEQHLTYVDLAGRLGFLGAAGEGARVDGRPRGQQGIVGCGDAVGQHRRVEVDIAGVAGFLGLHRGDGDGAGVDGPPRRGPGLGGVVGRIARLTDREHEPPRQRPLCQHADEFVEQVILADRCSVGQPRRPAGEQPTSAPGTLAPALLVNQNAFRP